MESPGVVADYNALTSLYRLTAGNGWKYSRNWNSFAPLAHWEGVRVNDEGRVVELILNDNNLKGEIPKVLGELVALVTLEMGENSLTGPIPKELGSLTKLETLLLEQNFLSGPIPRELGHLKALKHLHLCNNNLKGDIPEELGYLTKMEYLRLNNNTLTGTIPVQLGTLTALRHLYLHHNALKGVIPEWLRALSRLEELFLGDNELDGRIPRELGMMRELKRLHLQHNRLTGSIPEDLGKLKKLEHLELGDNQLTGPIPKRLGDLKALTVLHLHKNELSAGWDGSIPKELGRLHKLESLLLYDNKLTGPIPGEIGKLIALRQLNLGENGLTGPIPREIGKLTSLKVLYLHKNSLTGPMPKSLGLLTALTHLEINESGLTGSIPEDLGNLGKLVVLRLRDNKLTGPIPAKLGGLRNLEYLELNNNELNGAIPNDLGELEALKKVNLGGNKLRGGVPRSLRHHPNRNPQDFIFGIPEDGAPVPTWNSWTNVVFPLVVGYLDFGTDVAAVISYLRDGHPWWFSFGLMFIVVPALFAAIYVLSGESRWRRVLVALHLGLLAEAWVSMAEETYSHVLVSLRVVEPLYESTPQLMLQTYVLLLEWGGDGDRSPFWRIFSVVTSLFSLAYAVTGLVAEHPLSHVAPTTVQSSATARCPSLTGLLFGTVPPDGSVAVFNSTWHSQNFVWAFLVYQGFEIGARFIALALLALAVRRIFLVVLLYLWLSRSVILRLSLGKGDELLRFRAQLRLVGMPFMDSVMDSLKSYDLACVLTTVEFVAFVAVGNRVGKLPYRNEEHEVSKTAKLVLTAVAVVFMAGKLLLGFLIVRPFKRAVRFGRGEEEGGQARESSRGSLAVVGSRDLESGGSSRRSDITVLEAKRPRGASQHRPSLVELSGPVRRSRADIYEERARAREEDDQVEFW